MTCRACAVDQVLSRLSRLRAVPPSTQAAFSAYGVRSTVFYFINVATSPWCNYNDISGPVDSQCREGPPVSLELDVRRLAAQTRQSHDIRIVGPSLEGQYDNPKYR